MQVHTSGLDGNKTALTPVTISDSAAFTPAASLQTAQQTYEMHLNSPPNISSQQTATAALPLQPNPAQ